MMLTRAYDDRMYRAQRQGKTSLLHEVHRRGGGGGGPGRWRSAADDMCFPTYRQQGLLIARGYPLVDMMNQVLSNARDPLKGRQLPVLYSSREYGFFSISRQSRHPVQPGGRLGHGLGLQARSPIAAAWIGDGSTAEGDFHHALTFASVYRAPVMLNVVNNQWAISSFHGIAGDDDAPFASRAIGYGLPALRVDGNDFLAVYAATAWAAERARANLGATLIELVTYRAEGHSTSDDPSRYRPADEAAAGRWAIRSRGLQGPSDRARRVVARTQHAALEKAA